MRSRLRTITQTLVAIIHGFTAVLLLIAVVLNFANIVGRYLLGAPIFWAEEVMLFLLVGIVFLGNSVVGWEGKQLRMDVVLQLLSPVARGWLETAADLAVIAVSIVLIILGWPAIAVLVEFDQRSQAAELPLVIPQLLLPIGFALISILVAVRLVGVDRADGAAREPEQSPDGA